MKYRRDTPIGEHLREGEPYFLIRAQDMLALPTLAQYSALAKRIGQDSLAQQVAAIGVQFAEWQGEHGDLVKVAD